MRPKSSPQEEICMGLSFQSSPGNVSQLTCSLLLLWAPLRTPPPAPPSAQAPRSPSVPCITPLNSSIPGIMPMVEMSELQQVTRKTFTAKPGLRAQWRGGPGGLRKEEASTLSGPPSCPVSFLCHHPCRVLTKEGSEMQSQLNSWGSCCSSIAPRSQSPQAETEYGSLVITRPTSPGWSSIKPHSACPWP